MYRKSCDVVENVVCANTKSRHCPSKLPLVIEASLRDRVDEWSRIEMPSKLMVILAKLTRGEGSTLA
jgi:hypothetical protein